MREIRGFALVAGRIRSSNKGAWPKEKAGRDKKRLG